MTKRIAVVDNKKLRDMQQKQHICNICLINKGGAECIYMEGEQLHIAENLCIGCGICVKAAPEAINIINLPDQLDKPPLHRYGRNGFHLYNLPIPIFGKVVGMLGRNGIGKSTALNILSGTLAPTLGKDSDDQPYEADVSELIDYFKGTEAQGYFEKMRDGNIKVAVKPQMIDTIPKAFNGKVMDLLTNVNQDEKRVKEVCTKLSLNHLLDRNVDQLSGGELQRLAIAATVLKDANVYFFDEPTSYLDVKQRIAVSQFIRELATEDKAVIVIEHDLIILDAMTDLVHLLYGKENVYGVCSLPHSTKAGINLYLEGYLRAENIRFRNHKIDFHTVAEKETGNYPTLVEWSNIKQQLGEFNLEAKEGLLQRHEVVGLLGENGIGKTSFIKILAGVAQANEGEVTENVVVSYKPQYLQADDSLVADALGDAIVKYHVQLIKPLDLEPLYSQKLSELSGGQLQRVAIAVTLAKDADLYLLDEPSAYLDVEQRLTVSKVIKDFMQIKGHTAIVVDHDLLFVDYLSKRLMVFDGEPGKRGACLGPYGMQQGMNEFLKDLGLTFRRDEENFRPRVNKPGSQMDEKQRKENKLYYV